MSPRLSFLLATALAALCLVPLPAQGAEFEKYGLESVGAALSNLEAGDHPEFETSFVIKTDVAGNSFAATRDLRVDLPPGLLANLAAFPQCTVLQFQNEGCPFDTQLGIVNVLLEGGANFVEPLYYLTPGADSVARFAFYGGPYPNVVNVGVRSESDYGAFASAEGVISAFPLVQGQATLWAVPADPSHDTQRITPKEASGGATPPPGGRPSNLPPVPLTVNPTRCGEPLAVQFTATSYQIPSLPSTLDAPLGSISGCGALGFSPSLTVTPTSREAAAPSGLDVTVELPQNEALGGRATSHIRHTELSFPQGLTIAPGAAAGQEACSAEQAGFKSRRPAVCPDAAKLGTAQIDVPALERPLQGALYLRTPEPGDLFRIWLIADDLGLHLALPGELDVDKTTGQIDSAFVEMPQAPLREARVRVFGGPRGPLATPSACGTYETAWRLTPWSGTGAVAKAAPLTIDAGCGTGGFSPLLDGGSENPAAGRFSALITRLTRGEKEANIASLTATLPRGLSARLRGVELCEGQAAQSGECPPASRIGAATVAAGPGPAPLWLPQPGREPIEIFLSGPYKGAPLSIVVNAPAQAGPFDLGDVVSRAAIHVDPETAQATLATDPLPQIIEGVPISYRTIHARIDRPGFGLNPTSCAPKSIAATVFSDLGQVATPTERFQVGGCHALGFKPRLSLRLFGPTNRGAHPRLRAVFRPRRGDANASYASVALPRSAFLDQSHIKTICTRVQFAQDRCPKGSIYGRAVAFSPLLEEPLEGPVYLRSSENLLPDLVLALKGQIEVHAKARIDSYKGGIRTTFEVIPDAPITKVMVEMQGGHKGLLINSRGLCRGEPARAQGRLAAHNGRRRGLNPTLNDSCAKAKAKTARAHASKR